MAINSSNINRKRIIHYGYNDNSLILSHDNIFTLTSDDKSYYGFIEGFEFDCSDTPTAKIKILGSVKFDDKIKKVIFNKPATIVYWKDGTKTVVKQQKGDKWDKEKGLMACICKKFYGNSGKFNDVIKEWCGD